MPGTPGPATPDATGTPASGAEDVSADPTQRIPSVGATPPGPPPPPAPTGDGDGDGNQRWWWIALGTIVAIGIIVLIIVLLAGGDDDNPASDTTTSSSSTTSSSTTTTEPATTTTERATTTTAAPVPVISSFTGPPSVTCSDDTSVQLSWSTENTQRTTISIDGTAQPGSFGPSETQDVDFACSGSSHIYTLTAFGANNRTVTRDLTIAVSQQ
jgi:hypothetical protein